MKRSKFLNEKEKRNLESSNFISLLSMSIHIQGDAVNMFLRVLQINF